MEFNTIAQRIKALGALGESLKKDNHTDNPVYQKAYLHNPWFTPENIVLAVDGICVNYLSVPLLEAWLGAYNIAREEQSDKLVGIITAGNIPLVGFHDVLCAYVLGYSMRIKLSSKDEVLMKHVLGLLAELDPDVKPDEIIAEQLKDVDAIIATGSNNSFRYFEYYFREKPHLLRANRNSLAVLSGDESPKQLARLADDIFMYFGLGCRNVSKLYVPEGYDIQGLLQHFNAYEHFSQHQKYMNNYDYNLSLLMMNQTPHIANSYVVLVEDKSLASRIGVLHYEHYNSIKQVNEVIAYNGNKIQCIIGSSINAGLPFGQTQQPALTDYADGVDTIGFLTSAFS